MKRILKILIISTVLIVCISSTDKTSNNSNKTDFAQTIDNYLKTKLIEPTVIFNNDGREAFTLLQYKISWKLLEKGIEISINGTKIKTSDKVTLNSVWAKGVDSVNFANFIQQVKLYENDSLIGFVLTNSPCTGLACGVNFQLIYDLKSKKQSYFGRFRTGFEFELYNLNSDNRPDYISKTFYGRNIQEIDTTEFVMYSQTENGTFKEFSTKNQKRFWFKHIYSEFHADLKKQPNEEKWIEKINKNGR